MTDEELRELLAQLRQVGTDMVHVEAKLARGGLPDDLWRTLSAFANTAGGGVVILGVDETNQFEPVGVADPKRIQADLASLCDRMVPPLRPAVEVHELEGRLLVTAEVAELPYTDKPCFYGPAGMVNGAYIRVADGDRRMTQYEVLAMLEKRSQPQHDIEPVDGATLEELDSDLLQRFIRRIRNRRARRWQELSDIQILRAFRAVADTPEGQLVPTLAGYLCFGRYPQERFPDLCVTFVRYPTERAGDPGPAGERFLDNEKITGPIPVMVADTVRAIKRNMRQREIVRGLFREEVWEYPEAVLREAIVNALGHRDYGPMARGSHVQVQMYPTRLVVLNPGGLFGPVTVDDLGQPGVQAARNPFLMNLLEDLPVGENGETLCEHRGSGIAAMLAALRRAGMQPPIFEDRVISFQVTFSNASLLDVDTLTWLERATGGANLSDAQRLALAYLRQRSYIANQDYGPAPRAAPGIPEPQEAEADLAPARIRQSVRTRIAEVLSRGGEFSAQQLARLSGASLSSVRLAIRELVNEGLVQPTVAARKSPRQRYQWVGPRR